MPSTDDLVVRPGDIIETDDGQLRLILRVSGADDDDWIDYEVNGESDWRGSSRLSYVRFMVRNELWTIAS